jgi:hypothetical protein
MSVPFHCPTLSKTPSDVVPDIEVIEGSVPRNLPDAIAKGDNWQASPGLYLFRGGPYSGRFLAENGQRIILQRNPYAKDSVISAHLLASVIVAILRQRGMLVLHANVTQVNFGAIAITGESGSGKSTTQAILLASGFKLVSDDITVLGRGADNLVYVLPGMPRMNLCEDAAIKLGHDITKLSRNPIRSIKVLVPTVPSDIAVDAVPLKKIVILSSNSGKSLMVNSLCGAAKFAALQECIYGPLFPEEHHGLFPLLSSLSSQVEIVSIVRPALKWSAKEVAEVILGV